MATVDVDAIATRVRVVLAGASVVRGVSSTRFLADYNDGLPADEKAARAEVKPRYEVRAWYAGLNPANPPLLGTVAIVDVGVEVKVARALDLSHTTNDALRDDATSLAAVDADVIRQALSWPGNVSGCGLSQDMLTPNGAPDYRISVATGDRPGLIETVHTFVGIAIVTMAIT